MIRIAICDDDKRHGAALEKTVSLFVAKNKINTEIKLYEQSRNLRYDISEGVYYDLLLSDIEMPEMDGMNLAKFIKNYLPNIMIIFITGYVKYAVDAYELSVFRYIPKGELNKRLHHALIDAFGMLQIQADQYYTIQTPTRYEKIPLQTIIYIHREGKNSLITHIDNQTTKVRKSLAQVYEELNSKDFIFVGRGDIVNIIYIMSLKNSILELKNGERIPISQSNLSEIKEKLTEFWGNKI